MIKPLNKSILSALFCLIIGMNIYAQDSLYTTTVTTENEIAYSQDLAFKVYNFNGNIKIKYWDKESIKYKVTVWAQGWSQSETDEFAQLIGPILTIDTNKCMCIKLAYDMKHFKRKCDCETGGSMIHKNWFHKVKVKDFSMDYEIYIPRNTQKLVINNHNGDVELPEITNAISLQLQNGHLAAPYLKLNGNSRVYLSKSTAEFGYLFAGDDAYMNFKYCPSIKIDSLLHSKIVSRFSFLDIKYSNYSYLVTNNDSLIIKQLDNIVLKGAFSDLIVGNITTSADINMSSSGSLNIKNIGINFQEIVINGHYSQCKMQLPKTNYELSTDLKNTNFTYPTELFDANWTMKAKYDKLIVSKVIGNNDVGGSKITIKCINCDLKLQ